jgi:hypothetical protein
MKSCSECHGSGRCEYCSGRGCLGYLSFNAENATTGLGGMCAYCGPPGSGQCAFCRGAGVAEEELAGVSQTTGSMG